MYVKLINRRLGFSESVIEKVLGLLEGGATVPFIARYRKEVTGSLDEVQIASIQKEVNGLQKLSKRKETVINVIQEQQKLTPDLKRKIEACWDATVLEDLYLPYKKSRKTKADVALANGLEPLAKIISAQRSQDLNRDAQRFVKNGVLDAEEALEGARHIISAWMNQNVNLRNTIRQMYDRFGMIYAEVVESKKEEAENYSDYFNYEGSLSRIPSHRLLAMYRGEDEGLLKVQVAIDFDRAYDRYKRYYIKSQGACADQLSIALKDALKRLILPSIENEYRRTSKEKADIEAIAVFAKNLRQLLLASPLGEVPLLALDPGFRTGCKLVVLDAQGGLAHSSTIYPHPPQSKSDDATLVIGKLLRKYKVGHIAIGNGTAGRETYQYLVAADIPAELYMVNESGASIYSASLVAREEFPYEDITVRGAVSIGRRLMDPLAELVKLDPKSIGVGQYQHDVHQGLLKESLDSVVISSVNAVGINLNTASKHLLQYVSGIGPTLAANIVTYRDEVGRFEKRSQLLSVPRMGKKAFEQAAGFLRVKDSADILDNTGVHPERYSLVKKILKEHNLKIGNISTAQDQLETIQLESYVSDDVGLPTLRDIIEELKKPGLDPRGKAKPVAFSNKLKCIDDVLLGMKINGVISNITKFGAFVDIGIKESALIHISQITDRFISDPSQVLSLNQEVNAKVIAVDIERKRISLTLKGL